MIVASSHESFFWWKVRDSNPALIAKEKHPIFLPYTASDTSGGRSSTCRERKARRNMRVMRRCYCIKYTDYVCVDALGKLYDPDFITEHFRQLLKKHNLKKIRFRDLRHSCASVLLAQGVPMKQIQEWLGHSDMSTTVNVRNPHTNKM